MSESMDKHFETSVMRARQLGASRAVLEEVLQYLRGTSYLSKEILIEACERVLLHDGTDDYKLFPDMKRTA